MEWNKTGGEGKEGLGKGRRLVRVEKVPVIRLWAGGDQVITGRW